MQGRDGDRGTIQNFCLPGVSAGFGPALHQHHLGGRAEVLMQEQLRAGGSRTRPRSKEGTKHTRGMDQKKEREEIKQN